jgi:alginate O-acetyltransferase complex protein AlgI
LYLFLPVHFLLYFASKNKTWRDFILIVSSLVFYAWGEPKWISILIFSAWADYCNALVVEKYRGRWQSKAGLISSLLINFSLLGFFKYSGFIAENINALLHLQLPIIQFSLPIGISFYTFQTVSYVIDVYRGEVAAQKSPWKMLLFVSLFHQLVAGPIVRYKDIAEEIEHRTLSLGKFSYGVNRFVVGLAKKVLLANPAGELADQLLKGNLSGLPVLGAWFGISLFALQIYYDFSGYSDMAIGLGRMFGFTYKENFNYPYVSRSATEFWRRWHISLGSFFRDYVYIPLGGNRRHVYLNLFAVWCLTGLWHGASWNFVLWGLFYGVLIMIERLGLLKWLQKLPAAVSHIYLLVAALVGWVFFYFTNLGTGLQFLKIMFGLAGHPLSSTELGMRFQSNVWFFLAAIVGCTPIVPYLEQRLCAVAAKRPLNWAGSVGRPAITLLFLIVCTIMLVGKTYNPFLYFRF